MEKKCARLQTFFFVSVVDVVKWYLRPLCVRLTWTECISYVSLWVQCSYTMSLSFKHIIKKFHFAITAVIKGKCHWKRERPSTPSKSKSQLWGLLWFDKSWLEFWKNFAPLLLLFVLGTHSATLRHFSDFEHPTKCQRCVFPLRWCSNYCMALGLIYS